MHSITVSLVFAYAIQASSFGQLFARAPTSNRVQVAVNRPVFHLPLSSMPATRSKIAGFGAPFPKYRSLRSTPHAMQAVLPPVQEKREMLEWNSDEMSSLLAELEQRMAVLVAEANDAKLQVEAAKIQADAAKLAAPTNDKKTDAESEALAMADAAVERAEAAAVATEAKVNIAAEAVVQAAEAAARAESSFRVHEAREEAAAAADEEAATAMEADIQRKAAYLGASVQTMGALFPTRQEQSIRAQSSTRAEMPWQWDDEPLYGGGIRQPDGSILYNFHDSLDEVQTPFSISTIAAVLIGLLAGSGVTFAALLLRQSTWSAVSRT
eukprot:gnl/MRDRNA2_/MRDRNA2_90816_c0_seq1.p1 gnl/MRDRNA2_/MRDRNA2_90816_c0~~gnl/MRDRNA2_/MRDRNA2_90816_c0_seq1.p1  ORF type:complete len:325 (+),score=70.01 gnl/MRDRNA2_/MRDRNA2_90816_c0_seq1:113-1087(+)